MNTKRRKAQQDRKNLPLGWGYSVPSTLLSLPMAAGLLIGEIILGTVGYGVLEGYNLEEAFYMTIITISTVGFTEVQPLGTSGRALTALLILANIGIFAYLLAVFSYFVIQGEIFKKMHLNLIRKKIDNLQDHVILCGFGKYGTEAAAHFDDHGVPYVVIDKDNDRIETIQKSDDAILYVEGDATLDEILEQAGIKRAAAVVTALSDDADNLFIVLSARQLNPDLNIISRAQTPHARNKLIKAGADHVVMPNQIGGFYMATLVSKPSAVEFFSFITNDYHSDIGFEEVSYDGLSSSFQNKTIRELGIRRATGANIIGYKDAKGRYIVNPPPETTLLPDTSFIILGNSEQLKALRNYLSEGSAAAD